MTIDQSEIEEYFTEIDDYDLSRYEEDEDYELVTEK